MSELLAFNGLAYAGENFIEWRYLESEELRQKPGLDLILATGFLRKILNYSFHIPLKQTPLYYSSKIMVEDWDIINRLGGMGHFIEAPEMFNIVWWRKDLFSQSFSYAVLLKTDEWYGTEESASDQDLTITDQEFEASVEFIFGHYERLIEIIPQIRPAPLILNYEMARKMPTETLEAIFKFCGVAPEGQLVTEVPVKVQGRSSLEGLKTTLIKNLLEQKPHILERERQIVASFEKISL